jgi:hypothetical protein
MNLQLATPILGTVIVPGEAVTFSFTVKSTATGAAFNLTGYTVKGIVFCGKAFGEKPDFDVTGTVVSAAAGTATITLTSANTASMEGNQWGTMTIWLDHATLDSLHVDTVGFRTANEVIS